MTKSADDISLLDWFAGQALQLITATQYAVAGPNGYPTAASAYHSNSPEATAKSAYDIADAMLAEREKRKAALEQPATPPADLDGWIPHDGGPMPCGRDELVEVKLRRGEVLTDDMPNLFIWEHAFGGNDIIAWRPAKEVKP